MLVDRLGLDLRRDRPPASAASGPAASKVAQAHLVHLNPFPANLGDVLGRYRRVLVPEINLGQLSRLLRAEFLVDVQSLTKVQGVPFRAAEIETAILTLLGGN